MRPYLIMIACFLIPSEAFNQGITTSHESGLVDHGTIISLNAGEGDTVLYAFGGNRPNEQSDFFITSMQFTLEQPNELTPTWARISTTASKNRIPKWVGPNYYASDSLYSEIDSVGKCTVLWMKIKGCSEDSCARIMQWFDPDLVSQRHGDITIVSIVANPNDLYGPEGILVEGDSCLTVDVKDTVDQMVDLMLSQEDYSHLKRLNGTIILYDVQMDNWNIDSLIIHLEDSVANVYIGGQEFLLDELLFSEREEGLEIKASRMIFYVRSFLPYINMKDVMISCPPVFFIGDELFDLFPSMDLEMIKKKGVVLIIDDQEMIHESSISVKTSGYGSSFYAEKSLTVRFPKSQPVTSFSGEWT